MAENRTSDRDKKTTTDMKDEPAREGRYSTGVPTRGILYVIIGLIILAAVFFAGLGTGHYDRWYSGRDKAFYGGHDYMGNDMPMMGRFGGYLNSQDRAVGVVTAVNGSNFTVASNGSTRTVTTSGSTQYQGGNQVKVNDTVIVVGSNNNGSLSASYVTINP